jgi:hypothetical protein
LNTLLESQKLLEDSPYYVLVIRDVEHLQGKLTHSRSFCDIADISLGAVYINWNNLIMFKGPEISQGLPNVVYLWKEELLEVLSIDRLQFYESDFTIKIYEHIRMTAYHKGLSEV